MIFPFLIFFTSFILEGVLSNFLSLNSYFLPLFSLVSLIIIYPFFHRKEMNYLKMCALFGFFYDITYTDTFLVNTIIFAFLGFFILFINTWLSNNFLNSGLLALILTVLYRILYYFLLFFCGYSSFSLKNLFISINHSLIGNVLYAIILYFIVDYISYKKHIEKID